MDCRANNAETAFTMAILLTDKAYITRQTSQAPCTNCGFMRALSAGFAHLETALYMASAAEMWKICAQRFPNTVTGLQCRAWHQRILDDNQVLFAQMRHGICSQVRAKPGSACDGIEPPGSHHR